MNIVLYTIHCPACIVLQKKLDKANIEYTVCDDPAVLAEKGYTLFPILSVDGKDLSLSEANNWIKERVK